MHSFGVVTRDWKYIFWPYEDESMSPSEELYDTKNDPLELTDLAEVHSAAGDLIRMRSLYDEALRHWKDQAVPYHDYERFGKIFTRR